MEAFAIVIVIVVAAIIFVVTWFGVQNEAGQNVVAERDQLEAYRETLQKKALRAQLERWDDAMLHRLAYQLDEVEQRIARMARRP